jgi:Porphyromonas-type peptidyl-arginine deiminase
MNLNHIVLLGLTFFTFCEASPRFELSHSGTASQQKFAEQWNRSHKDNERLNWPVFRPFSEIEQTGYVVTNSENIFEMEGLREAIAQNLPSDVTLILYVQDPSSAPALRKRYGQFLGDRLKFLTVPYVGNPIWARDSLPFPVYLRPQAGAAVSFGLVDSLYPQRFSPDAAFAAAFSMAMVSTQKFFRGGNVLFDLAGNCFAEKRLEVAAMRDPVGFFKTYFGCASATILPYGGGLGDIDERLKFLEGNKVLTDNASYASTLEARGYDVHLIPQTGHDRETYMNTLYVNKTIFVPQMGLSSDSQAVEAYRDLGFNPVPVYTKTMADLGIGNIHCVTMNYPKGTFQADEKREGFVEFSHGTSLH